MPCIFTFRILVKDTRSDQFCSELNGDVTVNIPDVYEGQEDEDEETGATDERTYELEIGANTAANVIEEEGIQGGIPVPPVPGNGPLPHAMLQGKLQLATKISRELTSAKGHDGDLKNLMLSWYYAGYYTGLWEGQQKAAKENETAEREGK